MAETIVISSDKKITQVQGPLRDGDTIEITSLAKIGISIAEKDFMIKSSPVSSFNFIIHHSSNDEGEEIWMGRSCIYETDEENKQNKYPMIYSIQFPNGAPQSCLINITLLGN